MKLSEQQTQAFDAIMQFKADDDRQRFVLGGYAGTGKSTISGKISEEFGKVVFCAYTGKAANVLREKGNYGATTIHGAMYKLVDEDGEGQPHFKKDPDSILKDADLVIVDEYSMLSREIIEDIESMAKKVLYLGDPFQLPPMQGHCFLEPELFLTEIHRQALESPILRAATAVREGRPLVKGKYERDCGSFIYGDRGDFHEEDYDTADQIIVGYNDTRKAWNAKFRVKQGFGGHEFPCMGDKLICLKNNHAIGLFNGMIDEATGDAISKGFMEVQIDFGDYKNLPAFKGCFRDQKEKKNRVPEGRDKALNQFDYGYVITCHKSQGSEFDEVLILNQPIGSTSEEKRRWLYTAITRGKKTVKLVEPWKR